MPAFRIYYSDGSTYDGDRTQRWRQAPDGTGPEGGVQYVLVYEPTPSYVPDQPAGTVYTQVGDAAAFIFRGYDKLYQIYTGVSDFDPLGSGYIKVGELLPDAQYDALWLTVLADAKAYHISQGGEDYTDPEETP